jgi:hypothetical protein
LIFNHLTNISIKQKGIKKEKWVANGKKMALKTG